MNPVSLAIDIGGSKCVAGLVDREGTILDKERFLWQKLDAPSLLMDIVSHAKALLQKHPDITPQVIGASIPGLADPVKGMWVEASFSGIRNWPIAAALCEALGLPVYIDNDGQACALAERLFGACRDTADFLYMTVSNGIGGSIFADGKPYGGFNGTAGEIGHCTAVEGGRQCKCGLRGCLEMHAAGPAIARNYQEMGGKPMPDGGVADAAEIARRAQAGEKEAIAVYELEGQYLGRVIATACNLLNPRKVIIGGGVSLNFPLFEQSLKETVAQHMYRAANPDLDILPTALGYDGGLLGAAAVSFVQAEKRK
jgi:glucokinase